MTNPQLSDGYTRVANPILEALSRVRGLSSGDIQVALAVVRLSYGWQRKDCTVSSSDLAALTALTARSIRRSLSALSRRHIVRVKSSDDKYTPNKTYTISIQKDYGKWTGYVEFDERGRTDLVCLLGQTWYATRTDSVCYSDKLGMPRSGKNAEDSELQAPKESKERKKEEATKSFSQFSEYWKSKKAEKSKAITNYTRAQESTITVLVDTYSWDIVRRMVDIFFDEPDGPARETGFALPLFLARQESLYERAYQRSLHRPAQYFTTPK